MRFFAYLTSFGLALAATAPAAETALRDQWRLYTRPLQSRVAALSFDGQYVAYSLRRDAGVTLVILKPDEPKSRKVLDVADDFPLPHSSTGKVPAQVEELLWTAENRLVFTTNDGNIQAVNADGSGAKLLHQGEYGALPIRGIDGRADVIRVGWDGVVNVHTGKIVRTDGQREASLVDRQGMARLHLRDFNPPGEYTYSVPNGLTKPLTSYLGQNPAWSFARSNETMLRQRAIPAGFARDSNVLYYLSNLDGDTYGLYALNLEERKATPFKLEVPNFDLADIWEGFQPDTLVLDRTSGALVGARYNGLKPSVRWIDEELSTLQQALERAMPEKAVTVVDWSTDRRRFLVHAASASVPGTWFLFDRENKKISKFADVAPWITPSASHPCSSFSIESSGRVLTGYLTLPRQRGEGKIPVYVDCVDFLAQPRGAIDAAVNRVLGLDHARAASNPYAPALANRHNGSFNPMNQLLASRGFAVLQVNHRGCHGFGTQHRLGVRGEVAHAPVADIVTVLDRLRAEGRLDAGRVVIGGRGFGAFTALQAIAQHPDRFHGAVAVAPVTDLTMLVNHETSWEAKAIYHDLLGDDKAKLRDDSPINQVDKLTRPVLLMDETPQAITLRKALERAKRPPTVAKVSAAAKGEDPVVVQLELLHTFLQRVAEEAPKTTGG